MLTLNFLNAELLRSLDLFIDCFLGCFKLDDSLVGCLLILINVFITAR